MITNRVVIWSTGRNQTNIRYKFGIEIDDKLYWETQINTLGKSLLIKSLYRIIAQQVF